MSLWKKAAPTGPMTAEEGFCVVACEAVYQDGSVPAEEQELLMDYLRHNDVFRRHAPTKKLLKRVAQHQQEHGESVLQAAAEAMPENVRRAAYFAAADLSLADNDRSPDEITFLAPCQEQLGLSKKEAQKVLDAVAIKNGR